MHTDRDQSADAQPERRELQRKRMLTLSGGGWVVVIAVVLCLMMLIWAVGPAVFRAIQRPPGDGENVESYGFDLSTLTIPQDTFVPAMRHRDMPPRWDDPPVMTVEDLEQRTEEERGKYLVSTDRVIGVNIGGESRAYPISVLNVHEIINDTLGGVPIAVTYSWLGDAVRVFDRRVGDETLTFRVSGLIYNANLLMYDERPPEDGLDIPWEERGESLWSQLRAEAVSGPASVEQHTLRAIPAQLVSWRHWRDVNPETTVIERDPMLIRRYRGASPDPYFRSDELPYPVKPLAQHGPALKDRVIAVISNDVRRVYPVSLIAREAMPRDDLPARYRAWTIALGEASVMFIHEVATDTVAIESDDAINWTHAFWFAWHAMRPDDALASP